MPGSAPTPHHVPWLRVAYGVVGVTTSLTGALGNALFSVNLPVLQGAMGLDPTQGAWLTAVYVMANACASMLLFKARQQFGLRSFAEIGLGFYVLLMITELYAHSFGTALLVRAGSGFAASALSSLGFLYILQAVPTKHRPKAMVIALGTPSLAIPLARIYSTPLFDVALSGSLFQFQLGLALLGFAGVVLLKLPPSDRVKAFEPLDLLTFVLFASGMALLCAVLALGRIVWWTETSWVGLALCGSIVLLTAAVVIEHNREHPLLNTRWFATGDIVRFALISVLIRFVLSEQTYGMVGLLQNAGLTNEQFRGLYTVILLAMLAGMAVSAFTFKPPKFGPHILAAAGLIAIGSFMDTQSTSLTRPEDLYLSQGLLAFAGILFLAPAMLFGVMRAVAKPSAYIVSFIALFGLSQTLGGLAGSALIGTLQTYQEKAHSHAIVTQINPADPVVARRVALQTAAFSSTLADPTLRAVRGQALLSQQATREAHVLAYNDVFRLIGAIASGIFLWVAYRMVRLRYLTPAQAAAIQRAHPSRGSL